MNAANIRVKKMPVIYAAGRIERSRERFGAIECVLDHHLQQAGEVCEAPITFGALNGKSFAYSGPYTYGCDHSCSHTPQLGTRSHGAGVTACAESVMSNVVSTLDGENLDEENLGRNAAIILSRSLDGVRKCDILFAWLDDYECHGTLVEIGYAHALGKTIVIGRPPHIKPDGELWFAIKTAQLMIETQTAERAFAELVDIFGATGEVAK